MPAYKFYDTKGDEYYLKKPFNIFKEEYGSIYYWQNRKCIEDKIDDISDPKKKKRINRNNLKKIMAWKMGLLDRFNDEVTPREVACIEEDNKTILKGRVEVIIDKHLLDVIKEIDFKNVNDDNLKEVLGKLTDIKGVGPVYAITILHFGSKRKWPIYDRFADIALWAIEKGYKPWSKIEGLKLVGDASTLNPQKDRYKEYCKRLEKVFGEKNYDREVDQALWVYGHMFKLD